MNAKETIKHLFPKLYFSYWLKRTDKRFNRIKEPKAYVEQTYFSKFGVSLDLNEPKTFYEKLCFLKLFYNEKNPEQLIDKIEVKNYLKKVQLDKYTAKIIATYDRFDCFKQDFKTLKQGTKQFVVKLNHTSGDVFFFIDGRWKDKKGKLLPQRFVFSCLESRLKLNYYHVALEKIYQNLKPQILIEQYLPSKLNQGLDEYKFFLNYGEIKMINVVYGRQNGLLLKEAFTDANLQILPIQQNQTMLKQSEIYKPECFDHMVDFCKKTVSDRPIIRVDLMTDGKDFKFCEFTFYDCSGMNIFKPIEANVKIGGLFDIESIIESVRKK